MPLSEDLERKRQLLMNLAFHTSPGVRNQILATLPPDVQGLAHELNSLKNDADNQEYLKFIMTDPGFEYWSGQQQRKIRRAQDQYPHYDEYNSLIGRDGGETRLAVLRDDYERWERNRENQILEKARSKGPLTPEQQQYFQWLDSIHYNEFRNLPPRERETILERPFVHPSLRTVPRAALWDQHESLLNQQAVKDFEIFNHQNQSEIDEASRILAQNLGQTGAPTMPAQPQAANPGQPQATNPGQPQAADGQQPIPGQGVIPQMRELAIRDLEARSRQVPAPYGTDPQMLAARNNELEALKEKAKLDSPFAIPFSVIGENDPIIFTPKELQQATTDDRYARRIYEKYTGISPALPADVKAFQNKIVVQLPTLPEKVAQQEEYDGRYPPEHERLHQEWLANLSPEKRDAEWKKKIIDDATRPEDARRILWYESLALLPPQQREEALQAANLPEQVREYVHWLGNSTKEVRDADISRHLVAAYDDPAILTHINWLRKQTPEALKQLSGVDAVDTENKLFQRLNAPREQEEIGLRYGRVAPLNQFHDQATRLTQRNIGSHEAAFNTAMDSIHAANNLDTLNYPRSQLEQSTVPTYERTEAYRNPFERQVIDAIRADTRENFLEEVMPQITAGYVSNDAFHTGARQKDINKFAEKMAKQREREIYKMHFQNHEAAHMRAAEQNKMHMHAADIHGKQLQNLRDSQLRGAEVARGHGFLQKEAINHDITAIGQLANQQQTQAQNVINDRMNVYNQQQEEPYRRKKEYWNALMGHPPHIPVPQVNAPPTTPPAPPNMANSFGHMANAALELNTRANAHRRGGLVRNRFAKGGQVDRYKELVARQDQKNEYEREMAEIAQNLKKNDFDPVQNTFKHLSEQFLLNLRGRPGENFTKGYLNAKAAEADYKKEYIEKQKQSANIYNSLNQSRQNQEALLETMRHNRASLAESSRHHKESMAYNHKALEETSRHNLALENLNLAGLQAKINKNAPGQVIVGNEVITPKIKLEMTDHDYKEDARLQERKLELEDKAKPIMDMLNFIAKQKAKGNLPMTGRLANWTPDSTQTALEYTRLGKAMVQALGLKGSGQLTARKIAFMEESKPGVVEDIEAVYDFAKGKYEPMAKELNKINFQSDMFGNGIPFRYSRNAVNYAEKTKEDPTIYLKNVLEGAPAPKKVKEFEQFQPLPKYDSLLSDEDFKKAQEFKNVENVPTEIPLEPDVNVSERGPIIPEQNRIEVMPEQKTTPYDVDPTPQRKITPPKAIDLTKMSTPELMKMLNEMDKKNKAMG
jgi:hypothetical protein